MTAYEMRISHWSSHLCSSDLFLAALDDPSRHLQRLLLAALQHDQRLALLVAQVLRVDLEMLDDGAQPEPQFVHVVFVVPDDDASLAHDLERSEEHTSELQSLMRNSYAVFCLKKKKKKIQQ